MTKPSRSPMVWAVLLLAPALLLAAPVRAADDVTTPPWKAVAASGDVEARAEQASDWGRVARGDRFLPDTAMRTGNRGRVTLTAGAGLLILDPRSHVVLPAAGSTDGPSKVIQTAGTVLYDVDGRKVRDFKVVTPNLIAGVKGTVFAVTVNDRYTSVSVEEGSVDVIDARSGERSEVRAGEAIFREADERGLERVELRERGNRDTRTEARRLARLGDRREDARERAEDAVLASEVEGFIATREGKRDQRDTADESSDDDSMFDPDSALAGNHRETRDEDERDEIDNELAEVREDDLDDDSSGSGGGGGGGGGTPDTDASTGGGDILDLSEGN